MNKMMPSPTINGSQHLKNINKLISVIQKLSLARDLNSIIEIVRHAARELTGADGATFILRDEDLCYYVNENAIAPLWKGRRFPMSACISGWVMQNRKNVSIEDIYQDPRIPVDAYQTTFVKSLVMVPIRTETPIGAIGNYWASHHKASDEEIHLLQSLADSTSIALENVQLLSDLKKSLDETKKARDQIEHQLTLRDEFISITAHELNTPLTSLSIQFQFLKKLLQTGEFEILPQKEILKKIIDSCENRVLDFNKLISNFLDLSRIRLGKMVFQLDEEVDLSEITEKIISEYQLMSGNLIKKNIPSGIKGKWDRLCLEQVIRNLISNAVKFGEKKLITVTTSSQGIQAIITVEDHGIGISEEDQDRIFDRFERAVSLKNYGGMGLGLYISREIIHGHGGRIHVKSSPSKGSRFVVELPL
jgi:signal transduction histidine kinase